jgi:hypothetical protein
MQNYNFVTRWQIAREKRGKRFYKQQQRNFVKPSFRDNCFKGGRGGTNSNISMHLISLHSTGHKQNWSLHLFRCLRNYQLQRSMCYVRFEIFTAVDMMMFFWVSAPCRLGGRCQRFGLKMDTVCFSEMLTCTDESTRRHNAEEQHHWLYARTTKSKKLNLVVLQNSGNYILELRSSRIKVPIWRL